MMGATRIDSEQVRDFLHQNRREIAHAVEAHLYAHGIPLTGSLVMSRDDFELVRLTREKSALSAVSGLSPVRSAWPAPLRLTA